MLFRGDLKKLEECIDRTSDFNKTNTESFSGDGVTFMC